LKLALGGWLGASCAVVIACAARPVVNSAAPPPATVDGRAAPADPRGEGLRGEGPRGEGLRGEGLRGEIAALDREIAAQLARAQVAPPATAACSGAACATAMAEPFATPSTGDAACRPAPSARCNDACTLAGSICRDQQRICDLARQLAGDDWAANKCTGARASCQAAHDTCCSCVL
jgi:hypothetical protein